MTDKKENHNLQRKVVKILKENDIVEVDKEFYIVKIRKFKVRRLGNDMGTIRKNVYLNKWITKNQINKAKSLN